MPGNLPSHRTSDTKAQSHAKKACIKDLAVSSRKSVAAVSRESLNVTSKPATTLPGLCLNEWKTYIT